MHDILGLDDIMKSLKWQNNLLCATGSIFDKDVEWTSIVSIIEDGFMKWKIYTESYLKSTKVISLNSDKAKV